MPAADGSIPELAADMIAAGRSPHPRPRLARPRRPRRRRLGAPRRRVHAPLGRRRPGHRCTARRPRGRLPPTARAPRLPGRAAGQPLQRLPADGGERADAGGWAAPTPSSRSGTACRGSRRSGTGGGRTSRSCTTSTVRCGTRSCRRRWPAPVVCWRPAWRRRSTGARRPSRRPRRRARSCSRLGFRPELVTAVDNGIDPYFSPGRRALAGADGRRRRPAGAR